MANKDEAEIIESAGLAGKSVREMRLGEVSHLIKMLDYLGGTENPVVDELTCSQLEIVFQKGYDWRKEQAQPNSWYPRARVYADCIVRLNELSPRY